ncbi:TPA: fimbrial protein [Enterobacter asburiae]|nr:fimbrial protein [Enterobacter asburiae]
MNNKWMMVLSGIIMCISWSVSATPTGYCVADGGVHISALEFPGFNITAQQNNTGVSTYKDVDNGLQYPGTCYCVTDPNGEHRTHYTSAVINPGLTPTTSRNNIQYFYFNEYFDIGYSMYIFNSDASYYNAPFNYVTNKPSGIPKCTNGVEDNISFATGSKGKIYFYIKQPFIGEVVVPRTLIATTYVTLDQNYPLTNPLTDVYIGGSVIASQNCTIDGGQVIEFDFGKIPASEFSSTAGTALTNRKQTQTVNVNCTGMPVRQNVEMSLHADPVGSDVTMIQTTNTDVGIAVYDKLGNVVHVDGGRMATDMGGTVGGDKNGSFTFSAAPASATGAKPEPGIFNATATLNVEIEN